MDNISLIIDGQEAELYPSEAIEIQRRGGLFELNSLAGSFSVNFRLPYRYSPRNQVIFQFIGKPGTASEALELPFELVFRGRTLAGLLVASQTEDEVSAAFLLENGEFNDAIKDFSISKIPLLLPVVVVDTAKTSYTEDDIFAFAYFQNKAQFSGLWMEYAEDGDSITQTNNYCNVRTGGVLQTSANDIDTGTERTNYTNCPQIFLKSLLKNVFQYFGFSLENSFFDIEEFQNLAIFSPYDMNDIEMTLELYGNGLELVRVLRSKTLDLVLPDMKFPDLLKNIIGFFCASPIFSGKKVRFVLNSDVITNQATEQLPGSFRLISVAQNQENGYQIEFEPPSQDIFYNSWVELRTKNVKYLLLDLAEHYAFGSINGFFGIEQIDYYVNTANYYLYGKGDDLFSLKGVFSGLAKPELVAKGTDLQPIYSGGESFQHTVKAGSVGNHESDWDVNVPTVNKSYENTEIKDLRFGFVVNGAHDGAARFQCQNGHLDINNWPRTVGGTKTFWERVWAPFIEWVLYRKEIEAEIAAEDGFLFAQTWAPDTKYIDANGNKYIFTQITESYTGSAMGALKLKGWTVY